MDGITIRLVPTFHGVRVINQPGPTASDPMAQRKSQWDYSSLEEALNALPQLLSNLVEEHD